MTRDDVGDRGQLLLGLLLTDPCGRDVPYFRPRFLGDKYPTFDFIVEVVDNPAYFFFAQVKATIKIDCSVLKTLRDEVIGYWKTRDMVLKDSRFRE